jgi:Ankyrin repeats (3 copies)
MPLRRRRRGESEAGSGPPGFEPDFTKALYIWVGSDAALFVSRFWDHTGGWITGKQLERDLDHVRSLGDGGLVLYARERPEDDPPRREVVARVVALIAARRLPVQMRTDVHPVVQKYLDGPTRLVHQVAAAGAVELLRDLVDRGAPVDLRDAQGVTPLGYAAAQGRTDCVRLLLDAGASVHMAAKGGATPLSLAAFAGQEEAARLLVDAGATGMERAAAAARAQGHAQLADWLTSVGGAGPPSQQG